MKVLSALFGLLIGASICIAQSTGSLTRPAGMRPYPKDGKLTIYPHPAEPAVSLDQLVRMSDIPSAETHSLVSVTEVLAGTLPGGTMTIVLTQLGGKAGRWELISPHDPLVKPGERYILFLARDDRKHPPNTSAYPRYTAIGVNAGKAKIENQNVQFLPSTLPRLREHNDTEANAFIATVKTKVSLHAPEKKPRP
jgi:hypothetical protein